MVVNFERRPELLDGTLTHHGNIVRQGHCLKLVVGYENGRDTNALDQLAQFNLHRQPQFRVECVKRLVQQKNRRLQNKRARYGDTLLLPARELGRIAGCKRREVNQIQHACHTLLHFGSRAPPHLEAIRHIVGNTQVREQRVILKNITHLALVGRKAGNVVPIDKNATGIGFDKTGDGTQQCCLAAPGRPQQRQHCSLGHAQAATPEHPQGTEAF